jgi:hypothetical protein
MPEPVVADGSTRGLTWSEFRSRQPGLATAGQELLYQFGVGLAFLSTVRPNGGPRLHPICVLLTDDGVYAFLIPSPKLSDLRRDARYALHSYPRENDEDAFYVTGRVNMVDSPELRARLERQFLDERAEFALPEDSLRDQGLVEFLIERCLVTRTVGHGDANPRHEIWRAR